MMQHMIEDYCLQFYLTHTNPPMSISKLDSHSWYKSNTSYYCSHEKCSTGEILGDWVELVIILQVKEETFVELNSQLYL